MRLTQQKSEIISEKVEPVILRITGSIQTGASLAASADFTPSGRGFDPLWLQSEHHAAFCAAVKSVVRIQAERSIPALRLARRIVLSSSLESLKAAKMPFTAPRGSGGRPRGRRFVVSVFMGRGRAFKIAFSVKW